MHTLFRKGLQGVLYYIFGCICYYSMGMSPLEAENYPLTLLGSDDLS
jgi:hypothetical protein